MNPRLCVCGKTPTCSCHFGRGLSFAFPYPCDYHHFTIRLTQIGAVLTEALVGIYAVVALWLIVKLRQEPSIAAPSEALPEMVTSCFLAALAH